MSSQGPFAHWRDAIQPREGAGASSSPDQPDNLPPLFQFSQNSLQDYADCARRFQLRYVDGQRWPAAESEPIEDQERLMEHGTEFHLLVQRHILGIPVEKLVPQEQPLSDWWDAYLSFPPESLPETQRLPEIQMTTPISASHRLMARYDLLAVDPGERIMIVDWKTTQSRPSRDILARRLQTRVYPFVLAEAGAHLFGGPVPPEAISLVYWFAESPAQPETFIYNSAQYAEDRAYLQSMIDEIVTQADLVWPLTTDDFHCKYCIYRSLCERGIRAGRLENAGAEATALDVDFDFEFEFDEIEEIAF